MQQLVDEKATASTRCALVVACLCLCCVVDSARAADTTEFWPEFAGYLQLNERSRACVDAAYALGKESDVKSLDAQVCLDVSLKPIARKELLTGDWQRSKYLWARVAYDRIFDQKDSTGTEVAENRAILAFYARAPLPASIWLETRTRSDFRWIGDEYSNRYRFRLDATREFVVRDHTVVPYFNYEWFYDTRYDDWTRTLWTLGAEVTASEHFRYEAYVARQHDRMPKDASLDALGVVFKWYY